MINILLGIVYAWLVIITYVIYKINKQSKNHGHHRNIVYGKRSG